jgi:DNA-binding NarL/FixJ family response regulator
LVAEVRAYEEALVDVIRRHGALEAIVTSAPVEQAVDAVNRTSPDVVLLDMSVNDSLALVASLKELRPSLRVVALGLADAAQDVIAAAEAGVSTYVTRGGSVSDVVQAILDAVRGELTCSPKIAASLLTRVSALAGSRPPADEGPRLTPRELQIAQLIDLGLSNKEIAVRLSIEISTVKNHVHKVLEKLNARRRGEAVARLRPALTRFAPDRGRSLDLDPIEPPAPSSRAGD